MYNKENLIQYNPYVQHITKQIKSITKCNIPDLQNRVPYLKNVLNDYQTGKFTWPKVKQSRFAGCSHDCKYCYSKSLAIQSGYKTADDWKEEVFLGPKLGDYYEIEYHRQGIVFPADHDITYDKLDDILDCIRDIVETDSRLVICTKPDPKCIEVICRIFTAYWDIISFCFSIGSSDTATLKYWEPNAPGFNERLEALKIAYHSGFKTFVSCEPMLDNNIEDLIEKVSPFITNSVILSRPVGLIEKLRINGHGDESSLNTAEKLLSSLSDEYIRGLCFKYRDKTPKIKWRKEIQKISV